MHRVQPARCGAHTPQARVLRLLPRENARRGVRVCAPANAGCSLEAQAGTSEHGRAPRERAVLLAQWDSIGYEPSPTSAVRRAYAASAPAAPPSEEERAPARSCVHTCERRLLVRGRGWYVGARPCTERKARLAGVVGFHRKETDFNQRSAARALRRRACCASSRERERARARRYFFLRTWARKLLVGGRGWHVRARPCIEREGRLAGAVGFYRTKTDSNQRGAARVRCTRAYCVTCRERERARQRFPCVRAQDSCLLEAAAGASEHGRASRERAVSLALWAFIGQKSSPASAVRRAHAASARAAPPPEKERAAARSRVRTRERRLFD